jgi:hypothetical protein
MFRRTSQAQARSKNPLDLSPDLLELFEEMLEKAPAFIDRRAAAALISDHLFPVARRTIEDWRLPTQCVNGRAVVPTVKLLELAFGKLKAAPVVLAGRKTEDRQVAA